MSQSSSCRSEVSERLPKRRKAPPMRLAWPGRAAEEETKKKKPRRVTFVSSSSRRTTPKEDTELWTVRYAPQSSEQLAVAPKKVQEVRDWMQRHIDYKEAQQQSRNGIHHPPPILLLVGSPGIGKSTAVHCLAAELSMDVLEWTEGMTTSHASSDGASSIGIQTPLNALEQFLHQCGSALQPLMAFHETSRASNSARHKLLLLDELPYTHTPEAQRALQAILTRHVQRRSIPTILILSDAPEGKVRPEDLERYLHPQLLLTDGPWCHVIAMHPPTKVQFRRVMQHILASEAATAEKSYLDALHERCGGDLRHAISTLQFEMIGDASGVPKHTSGTPRPRDAKLSAFHALGKLLYAKRQAVNGALEFDPDSVMRQSDMELGNIVQFLSFHCVDFYTDLDEVASAMRYFSDVATLCDHAASTGSATTASSLTDVASALSCRIVAHTNAHPAPFSFRPLGAPKVYDVLRKRHSNQERVRRRFHSYHSDHGTMDHRVNDRIFAVDLMPFLPVLVPDWNASAFLDSHFQNAIHTPSSSRAYGTTEEDEADMELWKEQVEILKEDDIVEDIDDDEW